MLVRLIWHIDENNKYEKIVNAPDNISKDQIKNMFVKHIGVEFGDDCHYEVLKE